MTTEKTAAGIIDVIDSAFSSARGGTRVFLGALSDGRFVVASRFQVEVRTIDKNKAVSLFKDLCNTE